MPPKLGQIRRGIAPSDPEVLVSRSAGDPVKLPMPLFWDTPPWHTWSPVVAKCLFDAIQSRGILVSALNSELGLHPHLAKPGAESAGASADGAVMVASSVGPKMLPYRNERYGLAESDFDDAVVVDMQLTPPRDVSGRIAYAAEQIGRWEATNEDEPLSGGGWVPAMTLPPDVPEPHQLASKVNELRALCPKAAVVVSVTPEWIDESLSCLIESQPDAILIRMRQLRMGGVPFAQFTLRLIDAIPSTNRPPIWLTPPRSMEGLSLSVADTIKMMALGASAIAIDAWIDEVIEEIDEIPPPSSFDANPAARVMAAVEEILQQILDPKLEHFVGMYSSLVHEYPKEMLGTFDPEVAKALGLPCIGRF